MCVSGAGVKSGDVEKQINLAVFDVAPVYYRVSRLVLPCVQDRVGRESDELDRIELGRERECEGIQDRKNENGSLPCDSGLVPPLVLIRWSCRPLLIDNALSPRAEHVDVLVARRRPTFQIEENADDNGNYGSRSAMTTPTVMTSLAGPEKERRCLPAVNKEDLSSLYPLAEFKTEVEHLLIIRIHISIRNGKREKVQYAIH